MKIANLLSVFALIILLSFLSSCAAIEGIFKAGMGVGIFLVLAVVVIIVVIIMRMGKK